MNENINLVEILKDAPKGTKLWSPICGECELVEIDGENTHPIICRTKSDGGDIGCEAFTADGKFYCDYKNGECVLFPSKDNRDWLTFKSPWKKNEHFRPGQKILVPFYDGPKSKYKWKLTFYSHLDEDNKRHITVNGMYMSEEIIPYEGNENKLGKPVE